MDSEGKSHASLRNCRRELKSRATNNQKCKIGHQLCAPNNQHGLHGAMRNNEQIKYKNNTQAQQRLLQDALAAVARSHGQILPTPPQCHRLTNKCGEPKQRFSNLRQLSGAHEQPCDTKGHKGTQRDTKGHKGTQRDTKAQSESFEGLARGSAVCLRGMHFRAAHIANKCPNRSCSILHDKTIAISAPMLGPCPRPGP